MSRTTRFDNGFNNGRDDSPKGAKCEPTTHHPKGYNTMLDDHGHYGAGGSKKLKKASSRAQRNYSKNVLRAETDQTFRNPD